MAWKIETIFETVQAQISTLKHRDHETHGLGEEVDWTSGHWRNYSLPDHRIATQFSSHMFFSVNRISVLSEHVKIILRHQKLGQTIASENSSKAQNIDYITDIKGRPVEFVCNMYAGKTAIEILECIEPSMDEKGTQPSQFQDRIICMSMYNDVKYWIRTARTSIVTTQHESPSTHETSIQGIPLFLVLEMKISGMED